MVEKTYDYDAQFASRYIRSLDYSYTMAKNSLIAAETMDHTPINGTVLDIGGNINALLKGNSIRNKLDQQNKPLHYYVMDVSPAYFNIDGVLDEALENAGVDWYKGQIPGIVGDAHDIPFAQESIDTVIMADTLEHIENPQQVLTQLHDVLKPQGQLQLVLPTMYMLDQFPDRAKDRKKRTSHVNFFNNEAIGEMLANTGYTIEDAKGLDYVSGFLYLLYTNNDYVMRRNPKTGRLAKKGAMRFKELQTNIRAAKIDTLAIDRSLNDPTLFSNFISDIKAGTAHPLTIIHEALKLDPAFESSQGLQQLYEQTSQTITDIQHDFEPQELIRLMDSVLPQFTANSIFVRASKTPSNS